MVPLAVLDPVVVRVKVMLAVPALVRFFQRVRTHVSLQQLATGVRLFAALVRTAVRSFAGMVADVLGQCRLGFVRLVATSVRTAEGLFVGVSSPVDGQIELGVTAFDAEFTLEGSFVRVTIHFVGFERGFGAEAGTTVLANEFDSIVTFLYMTFERCSEPERCRTVSAFELVL